MAEFFDKKNIRHVFRNVQKHLLIEQLIRRFSSNKDDIRKTALSQLDLSSCKNVLELGCAFGSFTAALKDRLHPSAEINGLDIVPEYKPFFLDACQHAGYKGMFSYAGVDRIKKFTTASFDLIICSFALYFFVSAIPEIARILKKEGYFIAITHYRTNLRELTDIIKKILKQNALLENDLLPIEAIVNHFSAEDGLIPLNNNFARIISIDFKNNLIFRPDEINFLLEYFHFKSPFFLPGAKMNSKVIGEKLLRELRKTAASENVINLCKDDRIFICTEPRVIREV